MPSFSKGGSSAFTPEQLDEMVAAFTATLNELGLVRRDDPIVRLVAKTIIEVASRGDFSSDAMRDIALKQLTFFEAEKAATSALLRDAITLAGATLGNIQAYNAADRSLAIFVQQGFKPDFLRTFERVSIDDNSACARAMLMKLPIFIPNVAYDEGFKEYRAVAQQAGFASVLSIPLLADSRQFVGILSVHFERPQSAGHIRIDVLREYARLAANALSGVG